MTIRINYDDSAHLFVATCDEFDGVEFNDDCLEGAAAGLARLVTDIVSGRSGEEWLSH